MPVAGRSLIQELQPKRFLRRQQSYIAIAVAIYSGLWAADRPAPLSSTLVYTLPLCNLIALVRDHLGFLYYKKRPLQAWSIYLSSIFAIAVLGVGVVNLIEYPLQKFPGQSLWQFLKAGWKLPFMATMIVGVCTELYRIAREKLETRNRELQHAVEEESAKREMREKELQQAREIQQSLLPKQIPQVPGFEIDGAWEPAREVGGDYFDVIRLSDTKVGVCIADVVGKSVSAALLMANVQAIVRAFAGDSASPAGLCARVNSVLCSSISSGKFVTLFYGVLDARRRTFQYSNAGHLPPLLIRRDGGNEQLANGGAVVGVFPDWKYENSKVELSPGDRLVLFTDGISEAGMDDGVEFGENRLIASALECTTLSASALKTRLLNDARQFCAAQFKDDATLIVVSALWEDENLNKDERQGSAVVSVQVSRTKMELESLT